MERVHRPRRAPGDLVAGAAGCGPRSSVVRHIALRRSSRTTRCATGCSPSSAPPPWCCSSSSGSVFWCWASAASSGGTPASTLPARSGWPVPRSSRLGIASRHFAGPETLEIVSAGIGLLVIALEIAYLPALYGAFASRETQVTLLAGRSGTPAWGPEILARSHFLDTMDELPPLYSEWERWAATVSESHANYPALMWFRSPVSTRSWLLGLTAMMDSGGPVPLGEPRARPTRGAALPVHGDQLPALHGRCPQHPLRHRSAADGGDPAQPGRVRRGLSSARGPFVPPRARRRRGMAALPGLAGQLRADRRRPDPARGAPAGPLVHRPTRNSVRPSGRSC